MIVASLDSHSRKTAHVAVRRTDGGARDRAKGRPEIPRQVRTTAELVNKEEKQTNELLLEPRGELNAEHLTRVWSGDG